MSELQYKLVSSQEELEAALEVRRQVFVREQSIAEELTFDGREEEALHVVVMDGKQAIATARVAFSPEHQAKLERMAVLKPFRRKNIGRRVILFLLDDLTQRGIDEVVLHAQYQAVPF